MSKDNMKETAEKKTVKYKSVVIRNLLISATLTTALVSWFTTAQGLEMYIFKGNIIFAGLISAAVQGVLYALSISGLSLMHSKKIKGLGGRVALIVLWIFLLTTSISFSYVYISKTAYPDTVMRNDAEMSLNLYVQNESEDILTETDYLEKQYSEQMHEYIRQFGSLTTGGFDLAEDDIEEFRIEKERLKKYYDNNEFPEIGAFLITDTIQRGISKIITGNYSTKDFEAYTDALALKIQEVEDAYSEYFEKYNEKVKEVEELDARLLSFTNKTMEEYKDLFQERGRAAIRRDNLEKIKNALSDFLAVLKDCRHFAVEDFDKGTESELHKKSVMLMSEMNKNEIDTGLIMSYVEAVYQIMVEENISGDDPRMVGYTEFKQNVEGYNEVINVKQKIEEEISILTGYSESLIIGNGQDYIYNNSNIVQDDAIQEDAVSGDYENDEENSNKQDEAWRTFWNERLSALQSEIKMLPSGGYENEQSAFEKGDVLKRIADRKRLYLTELNDFDRAVSLLRETFIGFHKYGTMVIVSLIFAIGLDLFSLSAGILLYFYKPKKTKQISVGN